MTYQETVAKVVTEQSETLSREGATDLLNDINNDAQRLKDARYRYAQYDQLYNEVAKPILDARRAALAEIAELAGVGETFQDDEGIVYRLCEKKGQWIDFTPYEIKRTQRVYGESNVLARKTAEELGFSPFKPQKPENPVVIQDDGSGNQILADGTVLR